MAAIDFTPRKVRLANTHNALTRTRPVGGPLEVGQVAEMNSSGQWVIADGTGVAFGIVIGITDGRLEGDVGDDAEVLMMGIIAGFDVDPAQLVTVNATGGVDDAAGAGIQTLGIGLNDGLLYVRPDLVA
jgi:hypothetical protein